MYMSVSDNLAVIRDRVRSACVRAGREPSGVRLVGVTKTVPVERIREGVRAGIRILGENYVQEARAKIGTLAQTDISWHLIGHLQSNKAKPAVELFDWIHTVDRVSLARALDRQAQKLEKKISVLIQVNVGDEESKSGVGPDGLFDLFGELSHMDGLHVRGLMALPPYFEDPERVRPYFRMLASLLQRIRDRSASPGDLTELSMGMSHDFEEAVEEGATLIRIGTALFGSRPAPVS
jgi:hypothetical protein